MFKILVVEDELYAREFLIKMIREYDADGQFLILQAVNGEEGELVYNRERPELVLTDIRMPKMDGLVLLERIRENDSITQVVLLSAYSDFEYARTALSNGAVGYLLKPIERTELYGCLDKFVQKSRTEKKEALITGRDIVTKFIGNSIRDSGYRSFVEEKMFETVFPEYQLTVIHFRDQKPDVPDFLMGIEKMYAGISWEQIRFLNPDFDSWILVVCPTAENFFLQRRMRNLLQEQGCEAKMGVSLVHKKAGSVGDAYQEAWEALKYKIYGEDICFADRIRNEKSSVYYLEQEKENALRKALQEGNAKAACASIGSVFEELRRRAMVKAECLELLYTRLATLFLQAIGENGQEKMAINRNPAGILRFDSLEELEQYLCTIVRNLCRMGAPGLARKSREEMPGRSEEERKDVVEIMASYVRQHYNREISLQELAEKELFMNQDYLSYLFARKRGIGFAAYVKQVRMEKAREFLQYEEYSVTEVATMSGYNDTSQFIRFFKQETGMTPKKYRMDMRERKKKD